MYLTKKSILSLLFASCAFILTACSSQESLSTSAKKHKSSGYHRISNASINDPIMAIASLSEHQREWRGTRYRLGGNSKRGIDCSGFTQVTFRDLFGIDLPRTTTEQAEEGERVKKSEIRTGDLLFFKTGRGPNGKHVGIYVKNGQFLHASIRGGVIYSSLYEPYWSKTFWQARRM